MDTKPDDSDSTPTFMGVDRKIIPWWPRIDTSLCDGCNGEYDCLKFCPHRVYRPSKMPCRIEVENPYNCVVFCEACKKMCPKNAISFPQKSEILSIIKAARKSMEG